MLLNAEGLPIEHIDRIQITLNPLLNPFINFAKKNIDPTNQYRLHYSSYYGYWWFLGIQAQKIVQGNIGASIAAALFELLKKGFLVLPFPTNHVAVRYIYRNLDYFVSEVREVEFSFDFAPQAIRVIDPEAFIHCNDTLYSSDRRVYEERPARKSLLNVYNRIDYLKATNKLSHAQIMGNPFSKRIEFRLTKYNSSYRTLNNLSGTYHEVITRHIPYLAILYHRFWLGMYW